MKTRIRWGRIEITSYLVNRPSVEQTIFLYFEIIPYGISGTEGTPDLGSRTEHDAMDSFLLSLRFSIFYVFKKGSKLKIIRVDVRSR